MAGFLVFLPSRSRWRALEGHGTGEGPGLACAMTAEMLTTSTFCDECQRLYFAEVKMEMLLPVREGGGGGGSLLKKKKNYMAICVAVFMHFIEIDVKN